MLGVSARADTSSCPDKLSLSFWRHTNPMFHRTQEVSQKEKKRFVPSRPSVQKFNFCIKIARFLSHVFKGISHFCNIIHSACLFVKRFDSRPHPVVLFTAFSMIPIEIDGFETPCVSVQNVLPCPLARRLLLASCLRAAKKR